MKMQTESKKIIWAKETDASNSHRWIWRITISKLENFLYFLIQSEGQHDQTTTLPFEGRNITVYLQGSSPGLLSRAFLSS